MYARSGRPVNVSIARAAAAIPDNNTSSTQRPNVVPGVNIVPANQSVNNYLNLQAFSLPAAGIFGNAGRNLARGPSQWQIDTALEKRIAIFENLGLKFRAEAFNLLNHPQYGLPAAVYTSPGSFGAITSGANTTAIGTGTPRELQFALRLEF